MNTRSLARAPRQSGKNQAIEQVLRKLVELLTAKKDEASSSGKEVVPCSDTSQKLELMPIDIKLEGIKIIWHGLGEHCCC